MSVEDFSHYLESVAGDHRASDRLNLAARSADGHEAVADLARDSGFDVSRDDVAEVQRRLDEADEREGDLGDDELEGIAGGIDTHPLSPFMQWRMN